MNKLTFLLLALFILPFASADLTTDIESYYKFDTGSGTTFVDAVGNVNGSLVSSPPWVTNGIINDAVDYDGSLDYGSIGNNYNPSGAFTHVIWFNLTGVGKEQYIFSKGDANTATGGLFLLNLNAANNLRAGFHDGTSWQFNTYSTNTISANQWYMVAVRRNASNDFDMKVNDVVWTSGSGVTGSLTTTENFLVCARTNSGAGGDGDKSCEGIVDEWGIWDRWLTDEELTELYASGAPTSVQQYPFVNGSAVPFVHVNVNDLYDGSNIEGLTVYLGALSNTTQADGTAYFYNTTSTNYTVDGGSLYFNTSGTAAQNATTDVNVYGAFVNLSAYDLLGNSVSAFNVTGGDQSNQTTSGSMLFYLSPNTTNTVYVNASGYVENYAFNVTTSPQDTGSYNITGLYQTTLTFDVENSTGSTITGFTTNGTGAYNFSTSQNPVNAMLGSYEFVVDASGYALAYQNFTATADAHTINFTLYQTNSLNISFYDETTGSLINNVTLEYISNLASGNETTTNGNIELNILIPETYTLIYDADGYDQRFYEFTITDRTYNNLNLTLLNSSLSSTTTITVKDTLNNRVENATVKIYKYDVSINDDVLQEVRTTNFEGQTIASLILNNPEYRFVVEYEGSTVLTTSRTQIYGTSIPLIVDLIEAGGFEEIFAGFSMEGDVTFTNASNLFSFEYNDQSNTLSEACLTIYTIGNSKTQFNQSCSSASAGTLTASVTPTNGTVYLAEGSITESGGFKHIIDAEWAQYGETFPETGAGLLMLFLMVILFVTALAISAEIAVITAFLVPLMFTAMGLIQLSYTITVPLAGAGFVLAFIMGVIRR